MKTRELKILYVEDDAGLARLFQKRMSMLGHRIDLAAHGEEGLKKFRDNRYDIAVVDYQMPVMNGLEMLEKLGAKARRTPIIMLTGAGNEEIAVQAMKMGAADYLTKDFAGRYFELLPLVIAEAVERYELRVERIRMQKELQQYAAKLERSNRELEQFAYVVSHDLKEPLQTIRGFTALLAETLEGTQSKDIDGYIRYISEGTRRMEHLIEGLLDYSRVKFQQMNLEKIDLNALTVTIIQDLNAVIQEKKARVVYDGLPTVLGNANLMHRLMQNLIDNALKYCRERPPCVHIFASEDRDYWHISVQDNGIGISQKHMERIFMIFQRLHNTKEFPGDGLGLAICKKIVENHGGKIWVESRPGQGSTFHFTISKRLVTESVPETVTE